MKKLNLQLIILGSSNPGKIKEYTSFGLNLKSKAIPDLSEVLGTDEEVIIYKTLAVEENTLVEDTSLTIEGFDVGVNIKYLTEELKTNPKYHNAKATWTVFLGVTQEGILYLAKGEIKGHINFYKSEPINPSFGFDSVFVPEGIEKTLHELNKENLKENFSARKLAITNLLNNNFYKTLEAKQIPAWTGSFQT